MLLGSVGVTLGKEQCPEDAYEFGKKIKKLVKEKNLEGLFALVDGELTSGPRKRFIKGKKFSDIFSNHWRNDLLASDATCSPAVSYTPLTLPTKAKV